MQSTSRPETLARTLGVVKQIILILSHIYHDLENGYQMDFNPSLDHFWVWCKNYWFNEHCLTLSVQWHYLVFKITIYWLFFFQEIFWWISPVPGGSWQLAEGRWQVAGDICPKLGKNKKMWQREGGYWGLYTLIYQYKCINLLKSITMKYNAAMTCGRLFCQSQ